MITALLGLVAIVGGVCAVQHGIQQPFYGIKDATAPPRTWNFDASILAHGQDLSVLSTDRYETLGHSAFPGHRVRIKRADGFCNTTSRAYSGFIDVGARHLHFFFYESQNDPDNSDVILWTNGGPGGSGAIGMLMGIGPCSIKDGTGPVRNPYSWNKNANIFFIEQPVGVGFSYADYGEIITTTEDAAQDIAAFSLIFFETFSKLKGRPYHLAGESYGGRYIPLFGSAIWDINKGLAKDVTPINLTSVMIGNGMTDQLRMWTSYYDILCTKTALNPVLPISACVRMKQATQRCGKMVQESCLQTHDVMNCNAAFDFCEKELVQPVFSREINFYDLSTKCEGGVENDLCYPVTRYLTEYLNRDDIREILGIEPSFGNYSLVGWNVSRYFHDSGDVFKMDTQYYVANLLERGVPVLIYVGDYDGICNWIGNERFTLALEWSGQKEFNNQSLLEWTVDGKAAGLTRSANGLTFTTVHGGSHMVPYNKPAQASEMVERWLTKRAL